MFAKLERENKRNYAQINSKLSALDTRLSTIEKMFRESLSPGQYVSKVVEYGVYGAGVFVVVMAFFEYLPTILEQKELLLKLFEQTSDAAVQTSNMITPE